MHCAWVYILTNERHTVLYVGASSDLKTRVWEHQTKRNPKSFTARYNVGKLVYFEGYESVDEAFERERYIKGKTRVWKEQLINSKNPEWKALVAEGNCAEGLSILT